MNTSKPLAAISSSISAFNRGNEAEMASVFIAPGFILDGMAPHVWQGPTAAMDWYRDVLAEGKRHGVSGYAVTLGEPIHNNVTDDSAYVVVPASMTFNMQGKQVMQSGAFLTVALRRSSNSWGIVAWAWSKGK